MKGKKIGHYKIVEQLGEGGMGVVYKAEDTKLKRTVALKFLPLHTVASKQEKSRFTREAQAAAALNHSNIATVYAIDEEDGQAYIAMEYIEGRSLKELVDAGPLKMKSVVKIASQTALGLQAAQERGVIHRDIKSNNIMVTDKGVVKIMDFGLAKLSGSSMLTKQGTTLGTAAYMSPEQARGEDVDYRTDIWSLGVVLYEMTTGSLPFRGDYEQALVYAIMNENPEPLTAVRTGVPMELERIINKCLAKSPADRYQNANEIPVDLKGVQYSSGGSSSVITAPVTPSKIGSARPSRFKRMLVWGAVAIAFAAVGIGAWLSGVKSQTSKVRRLAINTNGTLSFARNSSVDIARNGENIVYAARLKGKKMLFLRAMNTFMSNPVQGTEGASSPFFSPDGQWIGFHSDGQIKKVSVFGGVPVTVAEVKNLLGASWSRDNIIYFAASSETQSGVLMQVSASSGEVRPLLTADDAGQPDIYCWPRILPGDKALLVTALPAGSRDPDAGSIYVLDLQSNEFRKVLDGGIDGRYSPTGHIVAAWSGGLLAAPFDVGQLAVTGPTVPVLEQLYLDIGNVPSYAFSEDGALVFVQGPKQVTERELLFASPKGDLTAAGAGRKNYFRPAPSPNKPESAVLIDDGDGADIWIVQHDRDDAVRLTDAGDNNHPVWSPDGSKLAFSAQHDSKWTVYVKSLNPAGEARELTRIGKPHWPTSWSPDGKSLLFVQDEPDSSSDVWLLRPGKEMSTEPVLHTSADEAQAQFSPDGRWIAYVSNANGSDEVYVRSFPGTAEAYRVSDGGGMWPAWHPRGDAIYYRQGESIMAASVQANNDSLTVSSQGPVLPVLSRDGHFAYSSRNDRFLFVAERDQYVTDNLHIVLNWFEELNHKVPSGKKLLSFRF